LVPTDINRLAADLIADRTALAAERGLTLDCEPDPSLPPALADPAMINQVMSNLMANATQYTPRGGIVTLTTALRRQDDRDWVTFTVQDTGPGILAKEMPHLFQRFFRGEAGRSSGAPGTGLGLAICQQIIDKVGGQITVQSQPGHGATFTVWLRPTREGVT
jgi:two-component system sensor histidine kinase BaeS